jgi:uncharacterized protein (DUF1330 family)
MTAYVVGQVTVHDGSWVEDYIPKVQAMVEAHGGRYLARTGEIHSLEGETPVPTVTVILEFPDQETAKRWHASAEYAPYLKARQAGSTGDLLLFDGL